MEDEDDFLPFRFAGFSFFDVVSDFGVDFSSVGCHVVECSLDDDFYNIEDNSASTVVDSADRSPKG